MKAAELKTWFVQAIRSGEFAGDTALPTRFEIMRRFGVARATADKVMRELCAEGLAYSRQGAGTFAVSVKAGPLQRVYIICATCEETDIAGTGWEKAMPQLHARIQAYLVPAEDVAASFSRLSTPGSRLIWSMPSQEHFLLIAGMQRARVPQVLINRRHPSYNYVATDTGLGLREALGWIRRNVPAVGVGLLAPPLNPARPYWAERELLFHETAVAFGFAVKMVVRTAANKHASVLQAVRSYIDSIESPHAVFIPEQSFVSPFLSIAQERGLVPGRDLHIVMSDYREGVADSPGILSLEQPYASMQRTAINWVLRRETTSLQALVAPRLRVAGEPKTGKNIDLAKTRARSEFDEKAGRANVYSAGFHQNIKGLSGNAEEMC